MRVGDEMGAVNRSRFAQLEQKVFSMSWVFESREIILGIFQRSGGGGRPALAERAGVGDAAGEGGKTLLTSCRGL